MSGPPKMEDHLLQCLEKRQEKQNQPFENSNRFQLPNDLESLSLLFLNMLIMKHFGVTLQILWHRAT